MTMFGKSQLFSTDSSLVTVQMPTKKRKLKEDERDRVKIRKKLTIRFLRFSAMLQCPIIFNNCDLLATAMFGHVRSSGGDRRTHILNLGRA